MRFRNHYECPKCRNRWSDEWDATCDDDCPKCGKRHVSPYESEDLPMSNQHGLTCPKCKSDAKIAVVVKAWALLTEDGDDLDSGLLPDHDHEWDDDSTAKCLGCGFQGKMINFDPEGRDDGPFVQFEYDLEYTGGDYTKVGQFALVPLALVQKLGDDEAFEAHTGHKAIHIVSYCPDDLYNADGELIKE